MRSSEAYKLLRLQPNASEDEILEAYERLFDRYEARAEQGDSSAVLMLDRLNEAHGLLLSRNDDSEVEESSPEPARTGGRTRQTTPGTATTEPRFRSSRQERSGRAASSTSMTVTSGTAVKMRRRAGTRPRSVHAPPPTSRLPYILIGVLVLGLLLSIWLLMTSDPPPPPEQPRGNVVATVNDVPIYEREFNERVAKDREIALSDPFISPLLENFQGITGTRAFDVLRYDSLDKLINLEVIQQQAKKENLYPAFEQQNQVVEAAKAQEMRPGETFNQFLTRIGVSAAQYHARVVENFVYTVMAENHMPKTGNNMERTDGFIRWICEMRQNYDVQVKVTFMVQENRPCTSGLPTDLPLPGLGEETPVPEPIPTAEAPVMQPTQPAPTATSLPANR